MSKFLKFILLNIFYQLNIILIIYLNKYIYTYIEKCSDIVFFYIFIL